MRFSAIPADLSKLEPANSACQPLRNPSKTYTSLIRTAVAKFEAAVLQAHRQAGRPSVAGLGLKSEGFEGVGDSSPGLHS